MTATKTYNFLLGPSSQYQINGSTCFVPNKVERLAPENFNVKNNLTLTQNMQQARIRPVYETDLIRLCVVFYINISC